MLRNRDKGELFLSQLSYLKKMAEHFRISNFKTIIGYCALASFEVSVDVF